MVLADTLDGVTDHFYLLAWSEFGQDDVGVCRSWWGDVCEYLFLFAGWFPYEVRRQQFVVDVDGCV
jgi:hypothetical protein